MVSAAAAAGTRRLDVAGGALLVATVGWTFVTGQTQGGDAAPIAALQLGCGASYAGARLVTNRQPLLVPMAVVVGATAALVFGGDVPSPASLGAPLGYANANAALYVLVSVAAVMTAVGVNPGPARSTAVAVAGAFACAAMLSASLTAALVLVLGLAAAMAWRSFGSAHVVIGWSAVLVQLGVALTAVLGVAHGEGDHVGALERALDERRVALWRDAAVIAHAHPLAGAGPGRFQEESPTARGDADARWAHSGFLQQGAEQGAVGLGLVLAAFAWGFARLWVTVGDDRCTALGAAALAALGLHAGVDYVLHFAAVPLVGAALVGTATASRRRESWVSAN